MSIPSAMSLRLASMDEDCASGRLVGASREHPAPVTRTTRPARGSDIAIMSVCGSIDPPKRALYCTVPLGAGRTPYRLGNREGSEGLSPLLSGLTVDALGSGARATQRRTIFCRDALHRPAMLPAREALSDRGRARRIATWGDVSVTLSSDPYLLSTRAGESGRRKPGGFFWTLISYPPGELGPMASD